jgi:3-methyladenine DNA glycosylase AlkD
MLDAHLNQILAILHSMADPSQLAGMARFGMAPEGRLGIPIPELRRLARGIPRDHSLAAKLWASGLQEARILASMVDEPDKVSDAQMDAWVMDFNSWDVCDQVCNNLFVYTTFAWQVVEPWAEREEEFVRRAAFTLIACLAWHDKSDGDSRFTALFPLIRRHAGDPRNFVKKAINWALRNIGKRSLALNRDAVDFCEDLARLDDRTARWIAKDALRELTSEKVQTRLHARKQ